MVNGIFRALKSATYVSALVAIGVFSTPHVGWSGTNTTPQRTIEGERYVPTVWIDPDGCEHWVMDDGFEGFMTPRVNREGIPVCRRAEVCGVMNTDQFFATNRYSINTAGQNRLRKFFNDATAASFLIIGHTDNRASDNYNMRLSRNRAKAVAAVATSTGVRVAEARGYGERQPKASNATASGRTQNRRVEIICLR